MWTIVCLFCLGTVAQCRGQNDFISTETITDPEEIHSSTIKTRNPTEDTTNIPWNPTDDANNAHEDTPRIPLATLTIPVENTFAPPILKLKNSELLEVSFKDSFRIYNSNEVTGLEIILVDSNNTIHSENFTASNITEDLTVTVQCNFCQSFHIFGQILTKDPRYQRYSLQAFYDPNWDSLIEMMVRSTCLDRQHIVIKVGTEYRDSHIFQKCFKQVSLVIDDVPMVTKTSNLANYENRLGPILAGGNFSLVLHLEGLEDALTLQEVEKKEDIPVCEKSMAMYIMIPILVCLLIMGAMFTFVRIFRKPTGGRPGKSPSGW